MTVDSYVLYVFCMIVDNYNFTCSLFRTTKQDRKQNGQAKWMAIQVRNARNTKRISIRSVHFGADSTINHCGIQQVLYTEPNTYF